MPKIGKTSTLFVALMLTMLTIGMSYALWDKTLYIDGTINTGEVNAVWIGAFNFDQGLDPNCDGSFKDKDVGSTTVTGVGTQTLTVTIINGYPCYFNDIQIEYENTGTIPVKVQKITITPIDFTLASGCGENDGEVWVAVINGIGTQLHPGDQAGSSFKVHVEQMAEELATYTFTVGIQLVQWNEYVAPGP